jgi:hypothetical protein
VGEDRADIECPLWVISGRCRCASECPLYPQKRTSPGPAETPLGEWEPTWQSKRFCFSEFVAAGDPENLNGFPAPVGPDGEWRRNWIRQCAEVVAAVDPVVQVFGSQQDVGRCHPFSAATYHPPALRCRIRGAGLICGRGIKKERAILNIGPGGATGDVQHSVVEPTREPELRARSPTTECWH